ncbi:hypothetical protein PIB30_085231 [Stylosanthes scabra]|uniref:Uncharacterized protein n=1 Tax=Stylosanthes scabra TaxID=79078 RepID=A0ABU6ZRG8_9FABA|nr:hypothetical protein [Stylosanthes scabra]
MGEGHDKEGIGGMEPPSRRSMLTRKILRKRFLFHLPCLWPSIRKKDYLRYIEELRRRPELSPLRSRQASISDSSRSQLVDSLPVIKLRAMIFLEFGNRHCRETCVCEVRPGKTVIDRRLESAQSTVSKIGMLEFGNRAVRPYKAWGWTDYATLHTLCVCVLSPRALGYLCDTSIRGNRRVTLASPTRNGGQPDLVNAYADIAAAIREPATAIRESNVARDRETM